MIFGNSPRLPIPKHGDPCIQDGQFLQLTGNFGAPKSSINPLDASQRGRKGTDRKAGKLLTEACPAFKVQLLPVIHQRVKKVCPATSPHSLPPSRHRKHCTKAVYSSFALAACSGCLGKDTSSEHPPVQPCSTETKPYVTQTLWSRQCETRNVIHLTLQNKQQQILFLPKSLLCFHYFKLTLPMGQLMSTPLDSSFSAKMIVSLLPVKSHKEIKTKITQQLKDPLSPIWYIYIQLNLFQPACFFSVCEKDRLTAD